MKQAWENILNTALIGTEKKSLQIIDLPVEVASYVNDLTSISDQEKLLSIAAYLYYYEKAGNRPKKYNGEINYNPLKESKDVINKTLKTIYVRITETGYYEKEYLLNLWLDIVIRYQSIITPEHVVDIIKLGISMTKKTRYKIVEVIGNRGLAILPLISEFKISKTSSTTEWKEGSPEERRNFIEDLYAVDPDCALSYIRADWHTENVVFKRTLIEIFLKEKHQPTIDFFQEIYNEEFAAKAKEKKTESECRYLLAKALLQHPQSQLHRYTLSKLQSCIVDAKKGGIMGMLGSKESQIQLPTSPDDFFNAENFNARYGISMGNSDAATFKTDVLFWFSELLAMIPFSMITSILGKSQKECLEYLLENQNFISKIEGKNVSILLNSIEQSVRQVPDDELIILLMNRFKTTSKYYLLNSLSKPKFEAYVQAENAYLKYEIMSQDPTNDGDWSATFSEKILNATFQELVIVKKSVYDQIFHRIAKHLNPLVQSKLENIFQKNHRDPAMEVWIKNVYQPVKTCIEIKSSLSQL